jgi:hypothetical protein
MVFPFFRFSVLSLLICFSIFIFFSATTFASQLVYSTFLGGSSGAENAMDIAVDDIGNVYLTGNITSSDFPITIGAYDTSFHGNADVFISKVDSTGSSLIYSSYLGGSSNDIGWGIKVDNSGNAYIGGYTQSADFPVTFGAYDTTFNGSDDVFITKLNPSGSALVYSTLIGGSSFEDCFCIAIDSVKNAYVTGYTQSNDFPTTSNAFDSTFHTGNDVFITKINSTGSSLLYSSYLGGNGGTDEVGFDIKVDNSENAYIVGKTDSSDFPTTTNAFDTAINGGKDVFVAKINTLATGSSSLGYSTFIGSTGGDEGRGIDIDILGNAYIIGWTGDSNFPTTLGAYDTSYNGGSSYGDVFVCKLNPLVQR